MGNKGKRFRMDDDGWRSRKAAAKRNASAYEARTGGDSIHRAAGRAVHEDAVRRGGLEASEGCRDRALQDRDKSRALEADAEFKSRDAKTNISEKEASVSSEKELWLAAEAVNMKAETDRLQAGLALRAERSHQAWHVDGAVYFVYLCFVLCCFRIVEQISYQVPGALYFCTGA